VTRSEANAYSASGKVGIGQNAIEGITEKPNNGVEFAGTDDHRCRQIIFDLIRLIIIMKTLVTRPQSAQLT